MSITFEGIVKDPVGSISEIYKKMGFKCLPHSLLEDISEKMGVPIRCDLIDF